MTEYYADDQYGEPPLVQQAHELVFSPRSRYQWIILILPILMCGVSWFSGGLPFLTDAGMTLLSACCLVYLVGEFVAFPRRFGIGGIVLYGGVLIWFCHDYFVNWFGRNFANSTTQYTAATISKAAFYHSLFIFCMCLGLMLPGGKLIQRFILAVPEPASETFYFILVLLMAVVGFSPFFIFTAADEPWYMALLHAVSGQWTGAVKFNVFRTGNVNYNWGAYVAQIIQAGEVGGLFAIMYAILVTKKLLPRLIAVAIWLFWTLYLFSGGRRGEFAFMALPPLGLLFVKYQAQAAMAGKRHSIMAYVVCGVLSFFILIVVQFQGTYRDSGYAKADISQLDLIKNQGNTMFSEGLLAWQTIPDARPFFKNSLPMEGFFRPIPEQAFWFAIGPIPRALWPNKPIDALWEWYNQAYTGNANGTVGTTISHGLVGSWYFNYGFFGVLEGGLLVGWLMGIAERSLQHSEGKPMGILMSLAFSVWLFRLYRDFIFIDIYGLIIGGIVLSGLIYACRPFFGSAPTQRGFEPTMDHGREPGYGV